MYTTHLVAPLFIGHGVSDSTVGLTQRSVVRLIHIEVVELSK